MSVVCFAGDALICVFGSMRMKEGDSSNTSNTMNNTELNTVLNSGLNNGIRSYLNSNFNLNLNSGLNSNSGTTTRESDTRKSSSINGSDADENYCLRALQCACELRKRENKHLACHIAVTVGEIKLGILGGYNDEWSYILNGSCLSELTTCINNAKPKQVVCSKSCYAYATGLPYDSNAPYGQTDTTIPNTNRKDNLVNGELCDAKNGNYLIHSVVSSKYQIGKKRRNSSTQIVPVAASLDSAGSSSALLSSSSTSNSTINTTTISNSIPTSLSTSTEIGIKDNGICAGLNIFSTGTEKFELSSRVLEAAEYFVPRPALSAIYSGSLDNISELRQVTTMFLHLDSYSPTVHEDPISLQPFFYLLQQILDETGGFLRQFLVDDKVR